MADGVITDALLLKATDYRDADRIVTLFTQHLGKLSAVARSAKGSKKRFAGALEPYAVVRVELDLRRPDLATLKSAQVVQGFLGILSDLSRMDAASAGLALLRQIQAERHADPDAFAAAVQFLTLLDHEPDPARGALLAFCMRVLHLSGITPRLDVCGRSGESVPEGKAAYFDPALGAVVARRFGGGPFLLSGEVRGLLMMAGEREWVRIARTQWDDDALKTARASIAAFVAAHVADDVAARLFPA